MAKTIITLQKLFSFPLKDFDTYEDLEAEEMKPIGQVVRRFRYTSPDNTYLDFADYFTEVQVNFFESGEYNIIFSGNATNTSSISNTTVIFWNALYALFGADGEGKTQMSFEDYYPYLRSGGELMYNKVWGNYYVWFSLNEDKVTLQIRSQAIKPILDKELPMESLLYFPDMPDHKSDTTEYKPDTQSSGCLSMVAVFVLLGSLLFLGA